MSDTLLCTYCKLNKSVTDFSKSQDKRGYRYNCKECSQIKYKKYLKSPLALEKRRLRDKRNKQAIRDKQKLTPQLQQKCYCCGELKLILSFGKDKMTQTGISTTCKECKRKKLKFYTENLSDETKEKNRLRNLRYNLKYNFNLTLEEYELLLKKQNYKCAICKISESGGNGKRLHVDHCHTTSKVRGLLCNNCNTSLGGFKDSKIFLKNAIEYLNSFNFPESGT